MIKKLLFFFFSMFISMSMMATEVTFLPSDFELTTEADYSTTKDTVTVAVVASTVTADQMRIFKGKTITISSDLKITSIEFTCTANGTAKYGPGNFSIENGGGEYTFETSGKKGTWIGSANEIKLKAKDNQVRATQIIVTVTDPIAPTGIFDNLVNNKVSKVYSKGQILIIIDEKTYNVLGQRID